MNFFGARNRCANFKLSPLFCFELIFSILTFSVVIAKKKNKNMVLKLSAEQPTVNRNREKESLTKNICEKFESLNENKQS